MKVSENIANTIDRFPTDFVFTYSDFDIEVSSKDVTHALQLMSENDNAAKVVFNGRNGCQPIQGKSFYLIFLMIVIIFWV